MSLLTKFPTPIITNSRITAKPTINPKANPLLTITTQPIPDNPGLPLNTASIFTSVRASAVRSSAVVIIFAGIGTSPILSISATILTAIRITTGSAISLMIRDMTKRLLLRARHKAPPKPKSKQKKQPSQPQLSKNQKRESLHITNQCLLK